MSEAHLLLVVVDLNLHEVLLKGVHPILILVLKVSLEALDTEVTLKKIREEKYNTLGLRVPFCYIVLRTMLHGPLMSARAVTNR